MDINTIVKAENMKHELYNYNKSIVFLLNHSVYYNDFK